MSPSHILVNGCFVRFDSQLEISKTKNKHKIGGPASTSVSHTE